MSILTPAPITEKHHLYWHQERTVRELKLHLPKKGKNVIMRLSHLLKVSIKSHLVQLL